MILTKNKKLFIILAVIVAMLFSFVPRGTAYASLSTDDVNIESAAAIVIDYNTGAVLYNKDMHKKIYPASTTKVLTAIVAIENSDMDDVLTVSQNALKGQEDNGTHVGMKAGEKVTMKDALYAMMLESANDASIAIAEGVGGSEEKFAKMLNNKCKELGLKDSNFVTPNGLFHENHYTTPYDMAQIIKYAYANEEFRELYSTIKYTMAPTNMREEPRDLYTTHRMTPGKSRYYENTVAGKTGYLEESKCNLSTVAKKGDMTLIAYVATNSSPYDICDDTQALFEKCFASYKHEKITTDSTGRNIEDMIKSGDYQIRKSVTKEDFVLVTLPKDADKKNVTFKLVDKNLSFPIEKDDITGTVTAVYDKETVGRLNTVAEKNMYLFGYVISLALKILLYGALTIAIVILTARIYFKNKRKKRRKKIKGYPSYITPHGKDKDIHDAQFKNGKNYHRTSNK